MGPGDRPLRQTAARASPDPIDALARLLDELTTVLQEVPREVYVARPVPTVSGSIGAQIRHTLDHVAALLAVTPPSPLSYDHRERGTAIETDPGAALRAIPRLKAALGSCQEACLEQPLAVVWSVSRDGEPVTCWSTKARELAFAVSHTIHHQAIIALLLVMQGFEPPARFGYAPSTPRVDPR